MGGGQMDMNYATTTGAKSSITAAFTAGALAAAATQFWECSLIVPVSATKARSLTFLLKPGHQAL